MLDSEMSVCITDDTHITIPKCIEAQGAVPCAHGRASTAGCVKLVELKGLRALPRPCYRPVGLGSLAHA
uniref:Uncharacterized protein n=1 Tax=Anguilla anguilla TaxID=7936 RepID=A0A0E9TPH7_ANGAN